MMCLLLVEIENPQGWWQEVVEG